MSPANQLRRARRWAQRKPSVQSILAVQAALHRTDWHRITITLKGIDEPTRIYYAVRAQTQDDDWHVWVLGYNGRTTIIDIGQPQSFWDAMPEPDSETLTW